MSNCEYNYGNDGSLYVAFADTTGFVTGEGGVEVGDDSYPTMVAWEMEGGTMLPADVRELGVALIRLAENAETFHQSPRAERPAESEN